jgi:menaquinone-dependent protoporphyrinogen IX oxidase
MAEQADRSKLPLPNPSSTGPAEERTTTGPAAKPSVLFVYYTYTQQTLKAAEAMAGVLRGRGCDVTLAAIAFTDPRYQKRFSQFPMPRPFLEVVAMIPAELRRRPAKIGVPAVVTERDYDLVCIGSPTWWLNTDVPVRSFLESDTAARVLNRKPFTAVVCCRRYWRHNLKTVRRLGTKNGGVFADGIHFRYQGGQVRSLLSLISYLGSGENRDRYLGVKIPPTNLQDYHLDAARKFADGLADHLLASSIGAHAKGRAV